MRKTNTMSQTIEVDLQILRVNLQFKLVGQDD